MERKNRAEILKKLGIEAVNEMQIATDKAISENSEVLLLSPTGSGKTLAFLLPLLDLLKPRLKAIQALILVPSRELAIQIEQVIREMGSGFRTQAVYGGRSGNKDRIQLKHEPVILVGTPGRVADHIRRGAISTDNIQFLILDEFDKSLEFGFHKEMQEIMDALPPLEKKILCSATAKVSPPNFVDFKNHVKLEFFEEKESRLRLQAINFAKGKKDQTLFQLLGSLDGQNGVIFCNFKSSIETLGNFLSDENVEYAEFFGGLEQTDRERGLIQFRNGTHRILLATDLAARGIDVPELDFIVHYQLPISEAEFTHRNGRTARVNATGTAYIIKAEDKDLPDFAEHAEIIELDEYYETTNSNMCTLRISAGRRDKISKGDIAGLFFKQSDLQKDELGLIELKHDCAFVAVPKKKADSLIEKLNNNRLKKTKVRITRLQ